MAFTYNSSNLGSSDLADVRLLIGDTDSDDELLQDAEIGFFTDAYSNVSLAASYAAQAVAGKFSRKADTANEGLRVSASQRAKAYLQLAKDLRNRAMLAAGMTVGGRSKAEKTTREADTDFVQPAFTIGADDYPGSYKSVTETT